MAPGCLPGATSGEVLGRKHADLLRESMVLIRETPATPAEKNSATLIGVISWPASSQVGLARRAILPISGARGATRGLRCAAGGYVQAGFDLVATWSVCRRLGRSRPDLISLLSELPTRPIHFSADPATGAAADQKLASSQRNDQMAWSFRCPRSSALTCSGT